MNPARKYLLVLGTVLGAGLALWGAFSALQAARLVEVITVFAGAFGAGASVTALVSELRAARRSASKVDEPPG